MSKEKENKFVDIEDPLANLGFDMEEEAEEAIEEIEETAQEVIDEVEEIEEGPEETEPKVSITEKLSEVLKPVKEVAEKKITVKNTVIILCNVVAVAIVAAIVIFSLYSGATYTSGRSVSEWAEEWNELSFSDTCTYTLYSTYQGTAAMERLMISDTDHVYLTDEDIAALEKGKTVSIFDDTAELSVETHKGDFKSATLSIDYEDLCEHYFGEDYAFTSNVYAPQFFEDSTIRVLSYMAMLMNPFNDVCNNEDQLLTAALDIYLANGMAYNYDGSNIMDFGDYTFILSYDTEENLVIVSDSDISATDVSGSDASASDMSATVEQHLIVNITCEHILAGEKKHAADWSWWGELFPEKEEKTDSIYDNVGELTDVISDSELSASDVSAADVSVSDAE